MSFQAVWDAQQFLAQHSLQSLFLGGSMPGREGGTAASPGSGMLSSMQKKCRHYACVLAGMRERYGGTEFGSADNFLVAKTKLDIVVMR